MHRRLPGWHLLSKLEVLSDGRVADFIDEIGPPVPLMARRIDRIKHALQSRMRQRSDEIDCRLFECPDGFKDIFGFVHVAGVSPNYPAHLFQMKVLGEWRPRRDR